MQQQRITIQQPIYIIGLCIRTNNADEMNPNKAKIGPLVQHYYHDQIANHLLNRTQAGVTIAAYANFESDEHGPYDYYIGEQVSDLHSIPAGLSSLIIPASDYLKLTTPPGKMPDVVIQAWMKIWAMSEAEFGAKRSYVADFEIYDDRAADPQQAVIDICLGIKA